jgi:hypothetical protein
MHVEWNSARVQAKRDKKLEDLEKRRKYRKAHGLDHDYWFAGLGLEKEIEIGKGKEHEKSEGEGKKEKEMDEVKVKGRGGEEREDRGVYVDWDGKRKPVKKWLGIW